MPGRYVGGKKQGAGKFWWPDGSMYSGQFKENEIDGVGVYTWSPTGGLAIVDLVRGETVMAGVL